MSIKTKRLLRERVEWYTSAIKKLPIDSYKQNQLQSDFIINLKLMETLANRNLLLQDISNIIVIVLSALVPVLINFTSSSEKTDSQSHLIWATIFSVILAICNAFRQSYKFREKWQNYRRTAELLLIEGQNYFALSGNYNKFGTHDEAFPFFISAISNLRINQINDYITTTIPESDSLIQQQINEQVTRQTLVIQKRQDEIIKTKLITEEVKAFVKTEPSISYDEIDHQLKLITFYINNESYKAPEKFIFKNQGLSDLTYKIVTQDSKAELHGIFGPSSGIKNADMTSRDFGSSGCFCMQNGKVVFVTCYHVIKHSSHDWDLFISGEHDSVISIDNNKVGIILEAEKTDELDTAIIEISDEIEYEAVFPKQLSIQDTVIYLNDENYMNYQEVYIISRTRGYKKIKGNLSAINKLVTLNYGNQTKKDMKDLDNLIFVHSVSTQPFSKTGDSGSLVFTDVGEPIGIIVGGDGIRCSFVIPFSTIVDRFNLSIL